MYSACKIYKGVYIYGEDTGLGEHNRPSDK